VPDEETTGQPTPVEPSPAPVEAAQPAAEPTPQAPALPEKFVGKSAEEIASAYLEVEKEKGRLAQEVGELRARVPQPPQVQQFWYPQQPTQPEVRPEFDYTNPEPSIERIVERRLEERERQRMSYEVAQREQDAAYSYNMGKEAALKSNPRLFEGIEPLVEQGVQMAYRQYNTPIPALRDPRTWERVAAAIRYERGEVDRLMSPKPQPPNPSATGVPNQTRQAKAGIELSERDREFAKKWGINEQEAKELIEGEMERIGGER